MSKSNNRIISLFWSRRLGAALKKYKVKTTKDNQKISTIADKKTQKEFAQFIMDEVLKGIGDEIPKERITTSCKESNMYTKNYLSVSIEISAEKDVSTVWWNPPCFHMNVHYDTVMICSISLGTAWYGGNQRNVICLNPQNFGKIIADIYKSRYEDIEQCKKEVAKVEKVQQMVGTSFKTLVENHLKGTDLLWAVTEEKNGKIQVNVKFTPRKIITLVIKSASFGNNYQQVLELIDLLDTLIRKEKVDITVRGESYHQGIVWQGGE